MPDLLRPLKNIFYRVDSRTIYVHALLTGVACGLVALVFHTVIHAIIDEASAWRAVRYGAFVIILLPAVGGLFSGLLTYYLAPEASGAGTDRLLETFHVRSGHVRKRMPFVKFAASVFTIASGGSAGKEGPMALIGAGIGSLLGKFIKMGARAQRTLFLAGAAGGLGAIFRAPLGGAITAVEVLYKEDFETDALVPCIISSVTAYTVFSSVVGFKHNLRFQASVFHSPLQLLLFVLLGLVCSGAGYLFIRLFRATRAVLLKLPIHPALLPAVGGLLVGVAGLFLFQATGEGLDVIQSILDGRYSSDWILASVFLLVLGSTKMLTTALTIQSGGSGGLMIPSLFIGATVGALFGNLAHHFMPGLAPDITPFIVTGMAAFFSAVTNASLAGLIMVTEFTGGYELLPPLMTVAVISLIMTHRWSIYTNQLKNKFASQAHLWDMNPRNLKGIRIAQAAEGLYQSKAIIRHNLPLTEIEKISKATQQTDFILENDKKEFVGILTLRDQPDLQELLESGQLLIADDLVVRKPFYVTENDSLFQAAAYVMDTDFDKVPVIRKKDGKPLLLGYLRHREILQAYSRVGQTEKSSPVRAG